MDNFGRFSKPLDAYEFLHSRILSGELPNQTKLPGIRVLARQFRVSRNTILTALAQLYKDGLLSTKSRSGTFVRSTHQRTEPDQYEVYPPKTKHQIIADDLAEGIMEGSLKAGSTLPPSKTLQFDFKASRLSISNAFRDLLGRGLIHRKGKSYVVGPAGQARTTEKRKSCIVIGTHVHFRGHVYPNRIPGTFFGEFEKAVQQNGRIALEFMDIDLVLTNRKMLARECPAGALYIFNFQREHQPVIPVPERKEAFRQLLSVMANLKIPFVLFSYSRAKDLFPNLPLRMGPKTYTFHMDDLVAGKQVGAYLASLGHRNVAYFSFYSEKWGEDRGKGLKEGLHRSLGSDARFSAFSAGAKKKSIGIDFTYTAPSSRDLRKRLAGFYPEYSYARVNPAADLHRRVVQYAEHDACWQSMEPFFEKALTQPEITAWVGADNNVASAATSFLSKRNIAVPDRISLMGIDDDANALAYRISNYDFQYQQMGYLAAHGVIGDLPIRKDRRRLVACPGRIVERGSVRRCS